MKKALYTLCLFFILFSLSLTVKGQSYTIVTIAGNGTAGYNGDGVQATAATLDCPYGIGVDNTVNVYTADYYNNRIRKRNAAGVISTIAGNGTAGYNGDGIAATAAELSNPADVCWSAVTGNIYVADEVNSRVRMINTTTGIISTIAGTGVMGSTGDGGQATAAEVSWPFGILVDPAGNIFIAEYGGERIRKINTSGIISTYAGNGTAGYGGDGGQATAANLDAPLKIALDPSGNLYIADAYNDRVRKVNTSGVISTYAGTGAAGFSGDGGQATAAVLNWPFGVGADGAGNVYVCDFSNQRIRLIKPSGIITTIAGNGTAGFNSDGSPATTKELSDPSKLVSDAAGNLYISEYNNQRDRELTTVILPIALSSFTADYVQQKNTVLCQWTVATQINNKLFTVEKTTDFQTWKELGTLQGAGNLSFSTDYSLTDYEPSLGTSYYRLTQTDFDGNQTIYAPVAVNVGDPSGSTASLYPNPVNESATLDYYSASNDEPIVITIIDAFGRTIRTLTLNTMQTGYNALTINTSGLVKGIYFMRVNSSAQNLSLKFIKD